MSSKPEMSGVTDDLSSLFEIAALNTHLFIEELNESAKVAGQEALIKQVDPLRWSSQENSHSQ